MPQYLVRTVRRNKRGHRVGKYRKVWARSRKEAALKSTMSTGIGSMAGMSVVGSMSTLPNMPSGASNAANLTVSGLNLLNIKQFSKNAMKGVYSIRTKKRKR
jgi:hypothetical protein